MDTLKRLVTEFLINSFVDDYGYTRDYVNHLNKNLEDLGIPYEYTYDAFCVELLERCIADVDKIEAARTRNTRELAERFGSFLWRQVREMENQKVAGYVI